MNNDNNCLKDWCKKVRVALIEEDLNIKDLAELTGSAQKMMKLPHTKKKNTRHLKRL